VKWGVYISGPRIIGWMLMRDREPVGLLVFDLEPTAIARAEEIQRERPYDAVRARPYVDGDESRGEYSADPG
jgi:hypothetical protein